MDGRRRLAEPVTDGAPRAPGGRLAAGAAPRALLASAAPAWRARCAAGSGVLERNPLPRGVGVAIAFAFVLASVAFGAVRGGHLPEIAAQAARHPRSACQCCRLPHHFDRARRRASPVARGHPLGRRHHRTHIAPVPRRRRSARPAQGQSLDRRRHRAQALSRAAAHRGHRAAGLRALAEGRQGHGDLRRRHGARALPSEFHRAAAGRRHRRRDPRQGFPGPSRRNTSCSATSCEPPSWSPSGAGTSCSTTASRCCCRKTGSTQALDLLVQLDRDDKILAATSPRSICACRTA